MLAGGKGTRLNPLTIAVNKQLLPVYDKPLIYYPLTTLFKARVNEILIITGSKEGEKLFRSLLGDGSKFGAKFEYAVQEEPKGIAEAFVIGKDFIGDKSVVLILGDNIFYGSLFDNQLSKMKDDQNLIFGCKVDNPSSYGVPNFDNSGKLVSISEKPSNPSSEYAVPGIYFYNNSVVKMVDKIKPSDRGELEITDLNNLYIDKGRMWFKKLPDATAWFDTGTCDHLLEAAMFVKAIQSRTAVAVGCPYTAALRNGWDF